MPQLGRLSPSQKVPYQRFHCHIYIPRFIEVYIEGNPICERLPLLCVLEANDAMKLSLSEYQDCVDMLYFY